MAPAVSRSVVRRLHRRRHVDQGVAGLAKTLWELEHGQPAPKHLVEQEALASSEEVQFLRGRVQQLGGPPEQFSPREAFRELQGPGDYAGDRCDLASLCVESLSVPMAGFVPKGLATLMGDKGSEYVRRLSSTVLPEEIQEEKLRESELRKPYNDPVLRDVKRRASLIRRLLEAGLVELALEDGVRVGLFAIKKANGTQRLIVDARLANLCFSEPSSPDLPTGASYSKIFLGEDESLYGSTCDLKDAFYTIELPAELRRFFTLDPIQAKHLGIHSVGGKAIKADTLVFPRLKVVPMGWNHAVNVCQDVVRACLERTGLITDSMMVSDGRPFPRLSRGAVVAYVDNIVCLCTDRSRSIELQDAINAVFHEAGLITHDIGLGETVFESLGWEFNGVAKTIRPKRRRVWRLRLALQWALETGSLSGRQLARLVGHFVSISMIRRECLSALHACYAYIIKHDGHQHTIWPSVRRELEWMFHLIPLVVHDCGRPLSTRVLLADASSWGKGVLHATCDRELLEHHVQFSERWRFREEHSNLSNGSDRASRGEALVPQWAEHVASAAQALLLLRAKHSGDRGEDLKEEHLPHPASREKASEDRSQEGGRGVREDDRSFTGPQEAQGGGAESPAERGEEETSAGTLRRRVRTVEEEGKECLGGTQCSRSGQEELHGGPGLLCDVPQRSDAGESYSQRSGFSSGGVHGGELPRRRARVMWFYPYGCVGMGPPSIPGSWEAVAPKKFCRSEGVSQTLPSTFSAAASAGGGCRSGHAAGSNGRAQLGSGHHAGLPSLPPAWRDSAHEVEALVTTNGAAPRRFRRVVPGTLPKRGRSALQDTGVRRHSQHRGRLRLPQQGSADGVRQGQEERTAGRSGVPAGQASLSGRGLCKGSRAAGPSTSAGASSVAPRRRILRRGGGKEATARSEATWQVDVRSLSSQVREVGHDQSTIEPLELTRPGVLRSFIDQNRRRPDIVLPALLRAISQGKPLRLPKLALEIFAGTGRWSAALRRKGYVVLEWDIRHSQHLDLCKQKMQRLIKAAVRARILWAIHLGTPCSSFSRARDRPGGPPPLRSNQEPWGKNDLKSARDRAKVRVGNILAKFSFCIFGLCHRMQLPVTLENPHTSRLWILPICQNLMKRSSITFAYTDFCMDGTPWRKRTGILASGVQCDMFIRHCKGTNGCCMRTKQKHMHLCGSNAQGVFYTLIAEPYPRALCNRWATAVDHAIASTYCHNTYAVLNRDSAVR